MSKVVKQILGECRPVIYRIPVTESALPVIKRDKVIPGGLIICPHCNQEIYEKHTFYKDGVDYHSDCGGAIEFPGPTDEQIATIERAWGMRYYRDRKEWKALVRTEDGQMVDPDTGV